MARIRAPFLVIAIILIAAVVLIEMNSAPLIRFVGNTAQRAAPSLAEMGRVLPQKIQETISELLGDDSNGDDDIDSNDANLDEIPGLAISFLAPLDTLLLLVLLITGAGLVIPQAIVAQGQGFVTALVTISTIIAGIVLLFQAIAKLLLMVVLFLAIPFGTIAYLIGYGSFDRDTTLAVLSVLMGLKVLAAMMLPLAHQDFLKRIGLMVLFASSLIANIIISFLHSFPPEVLVSITDALAAIVAVICAVCWSIPLLIGAVIAIIKSVLSLRGAV